MALPPTRTAARPARIGTWWRSVASASGADPAARLLVALVVMLAVGAAVAMAASDASPDRRSLVLAAGVVVQAGAAALLAWWARVPLDAMARRARAAVGVVPDHGGLPAAVDALAAEVAAGRRQSTDLTQTIEEKESARGQLLDKLLTAQEEERKRIARELHDGVGQALLSLGVGLKLLEGAEDVPAARSKAEELRRMVTETLDQVRLISRELRPSVLDDLGLASALDLYAGEFQRRYPEIEVDVHVDGLGRMPPVVEIVLYRIVQEAMTNAARHSGCGALSVLLRRRDGAVQAIIEDDGDGFDVASVLASRSSVGLHGMAERAEMCGGRFDVESGADGTTVYVEVPL